MSGWIRGIKRGNGLRRPGGIGLADSSDGSPALIEVFGVIEGYGAVGKGQIEYSE